MFSGISLVAWNHHGESISSREVSKHNTSRLVVYMVVKHGPVCKGLGSTSVRSRLASTLAVSPKTESPCCLASSVLSSCNSVSFPQPSRKWQVIAPHGCSALSAFLLLTVPWWGDPALQPPPLNRLRQIVSLWDLGGTKGGRQVCLWLYAHSKVQCHPSHHFQFPSFAPTADNLFHFLSSLLYTLSILYSFQKTQAIGWNPRISLQVTCQGIFHSQAFCPSVTLVIKNVCRWCSVRLILKSPTM